MVILEIQVEHVRREKPTQDQIRVALEEEEEKRKKNSLSLANQRGPAG